MEECESNWLEFYKKISAELYNSSRSLGSLLICVMLYRNQPLHADILYPLFLLKVWSLSVTFNQKMNVQL